MKKYLFLTILSLTIFVPTTAWAATEFVSTIRATGGDYSLLSTWEAAVQVDLTASTTAVYSGTGTGSTTQAVVLELFRGGAFQNATSTVVATTSTQILVRKYYNNGAPIALQNGDQWRYASSTDNMWTVSGSGVQLGDTAIAVAECYNDWPSGLDDNLIINGWTTDASNYVKVYAPVGQRHNGTLKDGSGNYTGFTIKLTETYAEGIDVIPAYIRIDGIAVDAGGFINNTGVRLNTDANYCEITNFIFKGATNAPNGGAGITYNYQTGGLTANAIAYDCGAGFYMTDYTYNDFYIYNSTAYNCNYGFYKVNVHTTGGVMKNCLASNSGTADFSGNFADVDYCASSDGTANDFGGTGNRINQTFAFVDEANDDFHLSPHDGGARNQGTDLSADANYPFTDDIDGQTRRGEWDIGADETFSASVINSSQTNFMTSGLVGYWSFDGGDMAWSANRANDVSGQGNHGTLTNMSTSTSPTDGISGQAFSFDGVDDRIIVPDATELDGYNAMSFSFWINPTDENQNAGIISKWIAGGCSYTIRIQNNNLYMYISHDGTNFELQIAYNVFLTSKWYHVVSTFDSGAFFVYGDGDSKTTNGDYTSETSIYGGNADLSIGDEVPTSNYEFNGLIDEVRIYDRALSADEVGELYRAGARKLGVNSPQTNFKTGGLVGYWSFDGGDMDWSANRANDVSGQGNHGTLINMSTSTSPTDGISGQALSFDGVDDYVNAGSGSSLDDLTSGMTISLWTNPENDNNAGSPAESWFLISKYGPDKGWYLDLLENWTYQDWSLRLNISFSDAHLHCKTQGGVYVTPNQWQHIVLTWDGSNNCNGVKYYIDSVLKTPGAGSRTGNYVSDAAENLKISVNTTSVFDGAIDDVRIYNRALSADEVGELYRAGGKKFKVQN